MTKDTSLCQTWNSSAEYLITGIFLYCQCTGTCSHVSLIKTTICINETEAHAMTEDFSLCQTIIINADYVPT